MILFLHHEIHEVLVINILDLVTESRYFEFVTLSRWDEVIMTESNSDKKSAHGGSRKGAGRKTKYENTVVIRVPEKYRDVIKALIVHLDECEMIDKNHKASESEPIFVRSLQDKPQQVSFTVCPLKG